MTKTFTTKNSITPSQQDVVEKTTEDAAQQNVYFYDSIKPQLNKLVKNPSEVSIEKILAYAKKK